MPYQHMLSIITLYLPRIAAVTASASGFQNPRIASKEGGGGGRRGTMRLTLIETIIMAQIRRELGDEAHNGTTYHSEGVICATNWIDRMSLKQDVSKSCDNR
jgi:uncharacterized membrane protein